MPTSFRRFRRKQRSYGAETGKDSGRGFGSGAQSLPDIARSQPFDGESGLVVSPGMVSELAAALRDLVGNTLKRKEMGKRARERVQSHFNISRTITQTLDLYTELSSVP